MADTRFKKGQRSWNSGTRFRLEKKCQRCDGAFVVNKPSFSSQKYCSLSCSSLGNQRRLGSIGSERQKTWARKMGKAYGPMKMPEPVKAAMIARMRSVRGPSHPLWKSDAMHGMTKMMKQRFEWAEWRKGVFERDSYRCMDCGDGGYLEPHHIIPLRVDVKKAFDKSNGITLCRECHQKTFRKEELMANTYLAMTVR